MGKIFNADLDTTLGGVSSSDEKLASQKAVKTYVDNQVGTKQATLVSGTNIKTVNNQSLLGSGNIAISSGTTDYDDLENRPQINSTTLTGNKSSGDLGLQDTLVSGTNIKTVNSTSLLGSGDIPFPTVDQIYSASSANAQSGVAVASGISNAVSGKVDKVNIANTIYGVGSDGNQISYVESTSADASTIVRRTTTAQISVAQTPTSNVHATSKKYVDDGLGTKQDTLVSGTNIKTINSTSLLGSGDISIIGLPSQTGQSGKYLTTDGTSASWATPSENASYDSTNKRLVL